MDHPDVEKIERTGYAEPQPKLKEYPGEYWDPIEWMKENSLRKQAKKEIY
ncbi:hypothetical protein J2Z83_003781 [Virgibacillus natechei]|uniref:Uncharacterized protein n=1 Tax=Virgibacillus natechei TaxID=1216297 RepID=A0ABS4IM35_9BACI|nr:hypothetical protein [Virgibacillus natechei]MBP1971630.1 hypothetical protein [Virgibacillus natechei]UZD13043.1 hypothetical protein OLD84_00240 [Virgibacillus natechei]